MQATEVSRLSRSTKQLCEIVELAQSKKIKLNLGGLVIDCTNNKLDPFTEGVVKILGVVGEMEAGMIRARVIDGLENAKAKGTVLGRRELTVDDLPDAFMKYYPRYINKEINVTELAKLSGIGRTSAHKYIKMIYDK